MSKKNIMKEIFNKTKNNPFTWADIKNIDFHDDDIISLVYVEPYYSENESSDGMYEGCVTRMVEETDDEYALRLKREKLLSEQAKERRYQSYLKLKVEFENQ
jgi:hypothetical protein